MAEHIQNQLARASVALRPSRVMTLARFLDTRTGLAAAPEAVLHLLIQDALERLRPPSFAAVAEFRGCHRALAALIEEAPRAALHGRFADDLARVFDHVEANLAARGMALRNARLAAAQTNPGVISSQDALPSQIVLDGFFSFSPSELSFLKWLTENCEVVVTLPQSSAQCETLLGLGFSEHSLATVHRHSRTLAFHAPTIDRELEEIARRILDEGSRGRPFREIGIILRSRDPYGPALETVLARFGIPARFYFANAVIDHPAIAFLAGILRAMLEGWNHESLLRALRMPISGLGATAAGDRFDFDLRAQLPGAGLPLRHIASPPPLLDRLASLDPWLRDHVTPDEWAARFRSLRALLPDPVIADSISRKQLDVLRSTAAALDLFDGVVDQTAAAHAGAREISLAAFWEHCETALSIEPLRLADRRRNVVHVMDVFEARQWELPVIFVCGLVERNFPQYHREDPLLNDAARRRGGLATSADFQREENFLFELATTRATEQVILSYAQFDDKGDETIPSFFLQGVEFQPCDTRVRPRPRHISPAPVRSFIDGSALRDRLAEKHSTLAPTSIESFLQCPFQFFAAKTLRLRSRTPAPRDRLDVLLQGAILHRALAERIRMPLLGAAVFDEVFGDECRRVRVPATYRTEAVRLELLRSFEAFWEDDRVSLGWRSRVEEEFSFALNALLTIRGRIDRMDVGPRKQVLVIDYKYSAGDKIRERVDENTAGHHVQGGLYLAAAERHFGLDPVGMLFCGLRKEVVWDGWHAAVPGLESIGESSTRARLRELTDGALAKAEEAFAAITSGRVAPRPADESKCKWCDFRDVCRIETATAQKAAEQ